MAGGLRKARFKIQKKKNSRVVFRTKGKKMDYPGAGRTEVTVTPPSATSAPPRRRTSAPARA
jgi:hypothetical protein